MAKRMVYLTHYEYYPIYEPAEGGYYYTGIHMCECVRMPLTQAREELRLAAEAEIENYDGGFGMYTPDGTLLSPYESHHCDLVNVRKRFVELRGRYIGDGELLIIENERTKGERERGYVPYE